MSRSSEIRSNRNHALQPPDGCGAAADDGKSGNVLVRDCEFVPEPSGPPPTKTAGPKLRALPGQAAEADVQAAQKLEFAQDLARGGKGDKARKRCEEIIKTYPDTRAAAEAKNLLRELE